MTAAPEKRCGACRACCVVLRIDTPEFHKAAGVVCPHHTGSGCGIYTTRYPICRVFLCGWRLFPELGQDWRPDRSGVLILQIPQDTLPEKYRHAGHGVQFIVLNGETALLRPGFAEYVGELVMRGVAVYLTAFASHALVNDHLEALVRVDDMAGIRRALVHLNGLLTMAHQKKGTLAMLPYLYRLQIERWRALVANRYRVR